MISHVNHVLKDIERVFPDYDEKQGYELAGFVWFQGWNDMVNRGVYPRRAQKGGYDEYSELLAKFIRDVRKDLESPKLPFITNAAYHYLGCAKTLALIGKAFAEATLELQAK